MHQNIPTKSKQKILQGVPVSARARKLLESSRAGRHSQGDCVTSIDVCSCSSENRYVLSTHGVPGTRYWGFSHPKTPSKSHYEKCCCYLLSRGSKIKVQRRDRLPYRDPHKMNKAYNKKLNLKPPPRLTVPSCATHGTGCFLCLGHCTLMNAL